MSKTGSLHYQLCCEGAKWLRRQKWNMERCRRKPCYRTEACGACLKYRYVAVELCTWNSENTDVWVPALRYKEGKDLDATFREFAKEHEVTEEPLNEYGIHMVDWVNGISYNIQLLGRKQNINEVL